MVSFFFVNRKSCNDYYRKNRLLFKKGVLIMLKKLLNRKKVNSIKCGVRDIQETMNSIYNAGNEVIESRQIIKRNDEGFVIGIEVEIFYR